MNYQIAEKHQMETFEDDDYLIGCEYPEVYKHDNEESHHDDELHYSQILQQIDDMNQSFCSLNVTTKVVRNQSKSNFFIDDSILRNKENVSTVANVRSWERIVKETDCYKLKVSKNKRKLSDSNL